MKLHNKYHLLARSKLHNKYPLPLVSYLPGNFVIFKWL
jgi:hypothetical protein